MNDVEITLIDNIKALYEQVGVKWKYLEALAVHLDRSPRALHRHFFSADWNIPENLQVKIIVFTQNYIANKNK